MILLSNVIKSQWAGPEEDKHKIISIRMLHAIKKDDPSADINPYDHVKQKIITNAEKDAEKIVEGAKVEAQSIREQMAAEQKAWEEEKRKLVDQAKQQGFSQGHAEGKDQGYKEYQETILFAKDIVNASKKDYQAKIDSSEETVLELGMKVAEKILGMKLADSEQNFLSLVKRALKDVHKYLEIQLFVHPKHYEFILAHKDELAALFPKETNIYIYPDEEQSDNNCMIETANGRTDASVDSQLAEMKRQLCELLESDRQ